LHNDFKKTQTGQVWVAGDTAACTEGRVALD